jgi:ABC-type branched-subunit amino acid transport system ATPase component
VIIEHDIPLVTRVSDRVVCMHLGSVLSEGTAEEVLADPAVIASYLGDNDAAVNPSMPPR